MPDNRWYIMPPEVVRALEKEAKLLDAHYALAMKRGELSDANNQAAIIRRYLDDNRDATH